MNTKFKAIAGLIFLSPFSMAAHSAEIFQDARFIAGASLGYANLSFAQKLDQDVNFPSMNLTVAGAWKRWQLTLNSTFSLQDAGISEEEDTGVASRDDLDLTLGYQFGDHWSLFAGYKDGSTDILFISREESDGGPSGRVSERYQQSGPYAGASYAWSFEKAGRLSISLAYAKLNAKNLFGINTDIEEMEEALEFDDIGGQVTGDTEGFSYGISWTMPLSGNLLFQTRFKVNDYQQDITAQGQEFKNIDESLTSLLVGLAYVF